MNCVNPNEEGRQLREEEQKLREGEEASQLFDRMNAEIKRNRAGSNQAVSQYQTMTTQQLVELQRRNNQLREDATHNFGEQSHKAHNINKCGCSIL